MRKVRKIERPMFTISKRKYKMSFFNVIVLLNQTAA